MTPPVEATLSTVEEALNLAEAQTATAIEVPAEDATPAVPADGANRKRSRVHEIFRKDGLYSFCQCQENVTAGGACGKRIKNDAGTKPLWNHVERFHPRKYLELGAGGHDEIACSATLRVITLVSLRLSGQNKLSTCSGGPGDLRM